jgi:hypothetical protein
LLGFGGFSSAVLGPIGPRGLDLAFGSHSNSIVSHSTAVVCRIWLELAVSKAKIYLKRVRLRF